MFVVIAAMLWDFTEIKQWDGKDIKDLKVKNKTKQNKQKENS